MTAPPARLNHAVPFVADVDRSARFSTDVFGIGAADGPRRRGLGLYHPALPDGNEFETLWMLPRDAWGDHEHAAVVEHLDLGTEVATWSGVRTAGRVVQDGERARA